MAHLRLPLSGYVSFAKANFLTNIGPLLEASTNGFVDFTQSQAADDEIDCLCLCLIVNKSSCLMFTFKDGVCYIGLKSSQVVGGEAILPADIFVVKGSHLLEPSW